jgi:hypothetical protein
MSRQARYHALTAILLFTVMACSSGPNEFPAADFKLKSPLTGNEVAFATLKGKPVIIYWFTSW